MNSERIGYQSYITGARYIQNTYYYSITGDEDRGYALCLFFGDIRIGEVIEVNTLDDLLTRLSFDVNIIWHNYSIL